MNSEKLLIVMSKAPVPGLVKTRLSPQLTAEKAAECYDCLLKDRISRMALLDDIELAVAYTPASAAAYFSALIPDQFHQFVQQGETLSDRLNRLIADRFAEGYGAVLIIDSDTPDLNNKMINKSFQLLVSNDLVYGPSRDGGYYLVGMKKHYPELFNDIPWSSTDVLKISLKIAGQLGLQTALLPALDDIDTYDDLTRFYRRFKQRGDLDGPGSLVFRYIEENKLFSC